MHFGDFLFAVHVITAPVDQSSQVYLADLNSMSSWHRFGYAGHSLRPPEQFALTKSPTRSETPSMLTNPVNSLFVRNQLVVVRTAAEIAATLDANGKTDGLPFMPEMAGSLTLSRI